MTRKPNYQVNYQDYDGEDWVPVAAYSFEDAGRSYFEMRFADDPSDKWLNKDLRCRVRLLENSNNIKYVNVWIEPSIQLSATIEDQ